MIRVFEAFSGYGSQSIALENLQIPYEVVGISEINKDAIAAYNLLHKPTTNYGDITKIPVSSLPEFDFFTYSFPCQDISIAGRQAGFAESSATRSSLLWYCKDIIEQKRPKYLLLENVNNIISKKFIADFQAWIAFLDNLGYKSSYKLLNAKDFGIPQNRERVFLVSTLNNEIKWRPIKTSISYLKDFLDKTYSDNLLFDTKLLTVEKDLNTLPLVHKSDRVAFLYTTSAKLPQSRRVYSDHGISCCLDTVYTLKLYDSKHKTFRRASGNEYLRLMGLDENRIGKLSEFSDNKKVILAGNSIVIPVLEYIYTCLEL